MRHGTTIFWRVRCVYAYGPNGPPRLPEIREFYKRGHVDAWIKNHQREIDDGTISTISIQRIRETVESVEFPGVSNREQIQADEQKGGTP